MKSLLKNQTKFLLIFTMLLTFISFSGCSKKSQNQVETDYPKSIVSLSPSATEILYAIGAENQVSAVSEFTDFPPEALSKPVVGGFDGKTLSLEKIISYKPDLVYLTDGMHNFMIEQLEQYGIDYYLSKTESVEAVENEILDMGKITGHEKEAEKVVADMKSKINSAAKKSGSGKSVYYEVWNVPFMSVGNQSFISDVIEQAGLTNLFSDIEEAYPVVSDETIIARNPQIILLPLNNGISADDVKARSGWQNIDAVKNAHIFVIDDNVFSRPGPRIADAITELSQLCD